MLLDIEVKVIGWWKQLGIYSIGRGSNPQIPKFFKLFIWATETKFGDCLVKMTIGNLLLAHPKPEQSDNCKYNPQLTWAIACSQNCFLRSSPNAGNQSSQCNLLMMVITINVTMIVMMRTVKMTMTTMMKMISWSKAGNLSSQPTTSVETCCHVFWENFSFLLCLWWLREMMMTMKTV